MGRSQKWPDLRSPISKIRDISFVGTDNLIIFRKFHNFPWNIVAVARWESYFVVGSLDLTWWPDLTWPGAEIFTKVAEKMGGKVGENSAALRAAVFFAILEKPEGGRSNAPPPAGRGLIDPICMCLHGNYMYMEAVAYSEISEEDGHVCSRRGLPPDCKVWHVHAWGVPWFLGMHACPTPQPFHCTPGGGNDK